MVKRILTIALWVSSGLGMLVLFAFARNEFRRLPVKSVQLQLAMPDNGGFLEYRRTYSMIMKLTDSIPGKANGRLDMFRLKQQLTDNPYVASADVFASMEGVLHINLKEREAVVRVFDTTGQSAYIDKQGVLIPLSPDFTARVIVANGLLVWPPMIPGQYPNVNSKAFHASSLKDIYRIAEQIDKDSFLKAFITQIYVDSLGEYQLTPRITQTNIMLGPATELEKKLKSVKLFYLNKVMKQDLNEYKTVSFKYKDQIVCTKREMI